MPSVKIVKKRTQMVYESLMSMGQKMNNVIFSKNTTNGQWLDGCAVCERFDFLEREREYLLSRFSTDRTVCFRRSKK